MGGRKGRRAGRWLLAALVLGAVHAGPVGPARASVSGAHVVAGPSGDLLEVGGVAMASDGTGGVVFRRRVDGRSRVFAARYADRRWSPPVQVDHDLPYNSSWPRIGAAEGGRLVVVFAHEMEQGRPWLFGATMEPGADGFTSPMEIDTELPGADGLYPHVAMNEGGRAYVAYRAGSANAGGGRPVRVARLSGRRWSRLGVVNRSIGAPMQPATEENSAEVAIDAEGNGVVAFQEPGDDLVDRIWARRLFGTRAGRVLQVSPHQWDGKPLRGPADAFSVSGAGFGAAAVAFRQQPGPSSPLNGPRIMVNTLPVSFDAKAAEFRGARPADGNGPGAVPSTPSVAIDRDERIHVGFAAGAATVVASGELGDIDAFAPLSAPAGALPIGAPKIVMGEPHPVTAAWPVEGPAGPAIAVQENPVGRSSRHALISAPIGGPVDDVAADGSGLGDMLVGFRQGVGPDSQVVVAVADAPPAPFNVNTPDGWVRPRVGRLTWEAARDATGRVRYRPTLDGRNAGRTVTRQRYRLDYRRLGDGRHRVRVVAIDVTGQETASAPATLRVDGTAPKVALRMRRDRLSVRLSDGPRKRSAGVNARKTEIEFGDGETRRRGRRVRHTYERGGRYRVVVRAYDRAGNHTTVREVVRAR
jgi:hypothetical protein